MPFRGHGQRKTGLISPGNTCIKWVVAARGKKIRERQLDRLTTRAEGPSGVCHKGEVSPRTEGEVRKHKGLVMLGE